MSKKTVACLHQQKAYYLLTVKGNQPTLLNALKQVSEHQEPLDCEQREDRSHGRWVYRRVSVYEVTGQDWAELWPGLQRGLCVERWGYRERRPFAQTHYYISNLDADAATFLKGLQGHWSIENRLHWPKDVVLNEDRAPQRAANTAANYSTIRNFFITAARRFNLDSIAQAKRFFANRLDQVLLSLQ